MTFTQQNTEGFTDQQIANLNEEATKRIPELMVAFGIDEDQAEKAFADEVAKRKTIRGQVEAKVAEQVSAASIKQHERNIETLYVDSDGEVFWDEQVDSNTELRRDDGTLTSIYRTGCGGFSCNCDACMAGDDPTEWAGSCDGIGDLADLLSEKLAEVPEGFFADEA